jgi:dTDP-4-dehydrorhamnose 3,5-epimerase
MMEIISRELSGVVEIVPKRIGDNRGYFSEVYKSQWFRQNVADVEFVQENESLSANIGTIRGLHFQSAPYVQGKLVRCLAGALFDVCVDIRVASSTFGKWISVMLSAGDGRQFWVPPGFAHGFCTLEPNTVISYKVTAPYSPEHDKGLRWNDPDVAVVWPAVADPNYLSPKDRLQPTLKSLGAMF